MDFYPENILLEITALLNAALPPDGAEDERERSGLAFPELKWIWWLEFFLQAGPEAFRDRLLSRPAAEQQALAVQVFRWFLYRPHLRRLYPTRAGSPRGTSWELARGGSLVSLAGEEAGGPPAGIYYIFPHRQIWPDLLQRPEWAALLPPAEKKNLEADLAFAARSRRPGTRERSEQLRSLLARPVPEPAAVEMSPPAASQPAEPRSPVKKPARKKKSSGQLSLFD